MKFAYIERVDDEIKVSERKLSAAIHDAIRPLGWKVSAMMDDTEVTKFIEGTNAIIKASGSDIDPAQTREIVRHVRRCPNAPLRIVREEQEKADRRQHILVTVAVILAMVALTFLYRCLK